MRIRDLFTRVRQGGFQVQRDVQYVDTWMIIKIEKNPKKLWKRYIAKMYKDGKLLASYPANQISEIDLKYFNT